MALHVNEGATKSGPRVVVIDKGGKEIVGAALPPDLVVAPADPAIATDTVDPTTGVITVTGGANAGVTNLVATGGGFTSAAYEVDVDAAPAGLAILDA